MRRSHKRTPEGERLEMGTGTGACTGMAGMDVAAWDLSSPILVESLAKGSLGSEIIARVVVCKAVSMAVSKAVSKAVGRSGIGSHPQR